MAWGKGILAGAALAAASLVIAPDSAEAGIVTASSGPSASQYPVGTNIDANQRITLREGDSLSVLENGGVRVFRGEGTYMLSQTSRSTRNRAFSSLTTQRSASRARTGAVRSAGSTTVSNPNLWYIDVATSGTICLPSSDDVRLWRANTQAESTYEINGGGVSTSVTFPAGEMLGGWDIYNPPVEGVTYRIGHGAGSNAVEVNVVLLEEPGSTPEELAAQLIENGCMVQLDQMSAAMAGG